MSDDEFESLIEEFLEEENEPIQIPTDTEFLFEEETLEKIRGKHQVSLEEVKQVLFGAPEHTEAKKHPDFPSRVLYYGPTRRSRFLLVSCEVKKTKN